MQNEDGEELAGHIMQQGKVKMYVVQGPVRFGPFSLPGEGEGRKNNENSKNPFLPGFTSPGPY
jgi:hypothetical protein